MNKLVSSFVACALSAAAVSSVDVPTAAACGCLSPPIPAIDEDEFAVNQQSEQIIFEVHGDGFITAHVLIRYAGRPENFAWIVPAPTVPDFEIGSDAAFGLLDSLTKPQVNVTQESVCPDHEYVCRQHTLPNCRRSRGGFFGGADSASAPTGDFSFNGAPNGSRNNTNNAMSQPVEVLKREQVGDYETIVFNADEAMLAIEWLNENGFIVNDTMTPYMQPYLDAGMVFVASRLVAGATAEQIKPLKMRYQAEMPMIPLQLTAVAAEPHLTVTSYILGEDYFVPSGHPLVDVDAQDITVDSTLRHNYPMVLSRLIDESGGDAFVVEFAGPLPEQRQGDDCCSSGFDTCGVQFDGICQCPLADFDRDDCAAELDELQDGIDLLDELRVAHPNLTRLTTRLSPEEMTFDPMFRVASDDAPLPTGALQLDGRRPHLNNCVTDVIDEEEYQRAELLTACATTYCGEGECTVTSLGQAACMCNDGFTARQFTELDGEPSVTCVPEVGTVDLAAGGLDLPTACKPSTCGDATCVDVGGFATCDCGADAAAWANAGDTIPVCGEVAARSGDAGARNYAAVLEGVEVCSPQPPQCGEWGWLVENTSVQRRGVSCESSKPDPSQFDVPKKPKCRDLGYGCCATVASVPKSPGLAALLLAWVWFRRRKGREDIDFPEEQK